MLCSKRIKSSLLLGYTSIEALPAILVAMQFSSNPLVCWPENGRYCWKTYAQEPIHCDSADELCGLGGREYYLHVSLLFQIWGWETLLVLGLGSVAIGFAFQDIFKNFFGVLLLLNEPFRLGDQIIVNDFEGQLKILPFATQIKLIRESE